MRPEEERTNGKEKVTYLCDRCWRPAPRLRCVQRSQFVEGKMCSNELHSITSNRHRFLCIYVKTGARACASSPNHESISTCVPQTPRGDNGRGSVSHRTHRPNIPLAASALHRWVIQHDRVIRVATVNQLRWCATVYERAARAEWGGWDARSATESDPSVVVRARHAVDRAGYHDPPLCVRAGASCAPLWAGVARRTRHVQPPPKVPPVHGARLASRVSPQRTARCALSGVCAEAKWYAPVPQCVRVGWAAAAPARLLLWLLVADRASAPVAARRVCTCVRLARRRCFLVPASGTPSSSLCSLRLSLRILYGVQRAGTGQPNVVPSDRHVLALAILYCQVNFCPLVVCFWLFSLHCLFIFSSKIYLNLFKSFINISVARNGTATSQSTGSSHVDFATIWKRVLWVTVSSLIPPARNNERCADFLL